MHNDTMLNILDIDNAEVTALTMLDLSSASDTTDLTIILDNLFL